MTEPITLNLPDMAGATVAVVTLNPGDVLVLTSPQHLPTYTLHRVSEIVRERLPGIECIVLDNGLTLGGIIRDYLP